jgi:hypothetical protein
LKEDLAESNNLADAMPDKVAELDALIDGFVKETGALYPKPNPDFRETSTHPSEVSEDFSAGLVSRNCELVRSNHAVQVVGAGRNAFLGTAQVNLKGPLTLRLRARSEKGGQGRVQWRTGEQDAFPESSQVVKFDLPADAEWRDVSVSLPIQGRVAIIRVYLPTEASAVDIQAIEYSDESGRKKSWDFSKVIP